MVDSNQIDPNVVYLEELLSAHSSAEDDKHAAVNEGQSISYSIADMNLILTACSYVKTISKYL